MFLLQLLPPESPALICFAHTFQPLYVAYWHKRKQKILEPSNHSGFEQFFSLLFFLLFNFNTHTLYKYLYPYLHTKRQKTHHLCIIMYFQRLKWTTMIWNEGYFNHNNSRNISKHKKSFCGVYQECICQAEKRVPDNFSQRKTGQERKKQGCI